MKTSQQGIELLLEREGVRYTSYEDSVGVWTIGVGHTGPEVGPGLTWSKELVEQTLASDLKRFEDAVNQVHIGLSQNQFDALVSFSFNVGVSAFLNSTLKKMLDVQDYDGATQQFDRWHIPLEITSRRNAEREQFAGRAFVARFP